MKISALHTNGITFKGYNKIKDEKGENIHHFYLPVDRSAYKDVFLELVPIKKDGNRWVLDETAETPRQALPMEKDSIDVNFDEYFGKNQLVGYRFKSGNVAFNDPGIKTDKNQSGEEFTVIFNKRTSVNKGGAMTLIIPDSYNPGYKFDKFGTPVKVTPADKEHAQNNVERATKSLRTHSNTIGGNFAGIAEKLDELADEGITRIVSTPFTKDDISSHKYWTENTYQIARSLGTEHDFKVLQQKIFEKGMNWVADGAFVNEGVQGVHFQDVLANGTNSPFYYWFKAAGLQSGPLKLGVFPNKHDCVSFKFVNPKVFIEKINGSVVTRNNPDYDSSKPTYIQVFDKNLASEEQQKDSKNLIRAYDKTNIDGQPYAINTHNDTVYPHFFDVKMFDDMVGTFKKLAKETDSADIYDYDMARKLLKGFNFVAVDKSQASGLEFWDGNIDIPKLSFYTGNGDQKVLEDLPFSEREDYIRKLTEGVSMVQDHTVAAGRYLTREIALIDIEHAAKLLGGIPKTADKNAYLTQIQNGRFPKTALEEASKVIDNILAGTYKFKLTQGNESKRDFIAKNLMNFPLDSFECNPDFGALIGSPFISSKVTNPDYIGSERFDLIKDDAIDDAISAEYAPTFKKMNSVYQNEFTNLALKVLENVHTQEPIFDGDKVTDFGKYAIQIYTPMIIKYALTKALKPNAQISTYPDGDLNFENAGIGDISKKSLGIQGYNFQREAEQTVDILKKGLRNLTSDNNAVTFLSNAISHKLEGLNENSFKLAEAIVDRTESGLCWRIDAAKDISCTDSFRDGIDDFEANFDKITDFWSKFQDAVKKENEHAYIVAEITDFRDLMYGGDSDSKDKRNKSMIHDFLTKTGINSVANYEFFFTDIQNMFTRLIDPDKYRYQNELNEATREFGVPKAGSAYPIKDRGLKFLEHAPMDGLINSYTFLGNHDKTRILHALALDMDLFQTDFIVQTYDEKEGFQEAKAKKEKYFRQAIEYTVNPTVTNVNEASDGAVIDKYSSKAIAMGMRIKQAFINEVPESNITQRSAIFKAISDLSQGIFKDITFEAEAFGVKPIDKNIDAIIDVAKSKYGLTIDAAKEEDLKQRVLLNILEPAMDKYLSMFKVLVCLPGAPTDYAGDNLAMTGFETYNKNEYQQNRNALEWFRLEKPGVANQKIKEFYNKLKEFQQIRSNPRLSALNDGAMVQANAHCLHPDSFKHYHEAYGFLRYNDKGSMVISLTNVEGANPAPDKKSERYATPFDRIYIGSADDSTSLNLGIGLGTYFKNLRAADPSIYGVTKEDGKYNVRCFKDKAEYDKYLSNPSGYTLTGFSMDSADFNTLILYRADNELKNNEKSKITLRKSVTGSPISFGSAYHAQNTAKKSAESKILLNA